MKEVPEVKDPPWEGATEDAREPRLRVTST